jgi:uncharacterized protein YukE
MMHYGFCRKHADQTGEGGCPECAIDHQQATISAMTETAKEASRVHVEMHNTIQAQAAQIERLTAELQGIASAKFREWDDGLNNAEDFVTWAQSRARRALAAQEKEPKP